MKRLLFAAAAILVVLFISFDAHAQCLNPEPDSTGSRDDEQIKYVVVVDGSPEFLAEWQNAIGFGINDFWNEWCLNGSETPTFEPGTPESFDIKIIITDKDPKDWPGAGTGACAAHIKGAEEVIVFFPVSKSLCSAAQRARVAGHELGHPLGLNDAKADCEDDAYIMLVSAVSTRTDLHPDECAAVDDIYKLPGEPGDDDGDPEPISPLVLDLDRNGIHTSSVYYDPVEFDLDADGATDQVGWLARGTRDAFLWIDLNGDDVPNNGGELFGNASALPGSGPASNGIEALASYDENGDGKITVADEVWYQLLLWNDWDHSGTIGRDERMRLSESGVVGISLRASRRNWQDENGNTHSHMTAYWIPGSNGRGFQRGVMEDIWFLVLPSKPPLSGAVQ